MRIQSKYAAWYEKGLTKKETFLHFDVPLCIKNYIFPIVCRFFGGHGKSSKSDKISTFCQYFFLLLEKSLEYGTMI